MFTYHSYTQFTKKIVLAGTLLAVTSPAFSALEEIIVTAQRRSESLQNVPITVNIISGDNLQKSGISDTSELAQVIPSFRIDYNGTWAQPAIRGVGTALANVGGGSAVGVYVDGFLIPSPLTSDFAFLNVDSIQVLKGPQGTLFGRNTTGGAVLVTTSAPSLDDSRLEMRASYSEYNELDLKLYGSTALSDNIAVDASVLYNKGDGFVTNIITGDDEYGEHDDSSIRLGLLYNMSDTASLLFRYSHTKKDDPSAYLYGAVDNKTIGVFIPGAIWGSKRGEVALDETSNVFHESTVDTASLTAEFDLGWATFVSRTLYRDQEVNQALDLDSTNIPALGVELPNNDKLYTQEFVLTGDTDRVNWVVGAFAMQDTNTQDFFILTPPAAGFLYDLESKITSYALFGDATYQATDKLFLTLGVRYSDEENEGFYRFAGGPKVLSKASWDDVSPRFVARYEISSTSSVYASVTKGFKSGLLDVNSLGVNTEIDSEDITAYEVGYKTVLDRTRLEASAFLYDYKDLQVSSYVGTFSFTTNAASTEVYGAELTLAHDFTDNFNISLGVGYTHAEYESYPEAPFHVLDPATGGYGYINVDATGNQAQRAPELTGNISASYTRELAGGQLELFGNIYYTSEVFFDPGNQYSEDAYSLVNLRATWTEASGHWSFSVFGNNVTDEEYFDQVLPGPLAAQQSFGDPSIYGVSVSYSY